ncbi:MAG: thioredoxin domain-containing protein [Deltaproteobacteria bacterium]|nr:thioredoxin domain-containing protein [Deltaproteobacteria bacterium]
MTGMWTRVRGFFAVVGGALAIALVLSSNEIVKVEFKYGWFGWVVSIGCIVWGLYAMVTGDGPKQAAAAAAAEQAARARAAAAGDRCPRCAAAAPEGSATCPSCGFPVRRLCPTCGKAVSSLAVACPNCTAPLVPTAAPPAPLPGVMPVGAPGTVPVAVPAAVGVSRKAVIVTVAVLAGVAVLAVGLWALFGMRSESHGVAAAVALEGAYTSTTGRPPRTDWAPEAAVAELAPPVALTIPAPPVELASAVAEPESMTARTLSGESADITFFLADSPVLGDAGALHTVVAFVDFQCRHSAKVMRYLIEYARAHPDRLRIVHKDLPMESHRLARRAAAAGRVVQDHGRFWDFASALWALDGRLPDRAGFADAAEAAGVGKDLFEAASSLTRDDSRIGDDERLARELRVGNTPTLLIDGRWIEGALLAEIAAAIDDPAPPPAAAPAPRPSRRRVPSDDPLANPWK